jgi:transcriptional regulator with XRE-family HTH domain
VTFGQRLKAHRLAAKLTQRELAEKAGLLKPTLSSEYECDARAPEWPNLTRLLAVLGLRLLQVPPVRPVPAQSQRPAARS